MWYMLSLFQYRTSADDVELPHRSVKRRDNIRVTQRIRQKQNWSAHGTIQFPLPSACHTCVHTPLFRSCPRWRGGARSVADGLRARVSSALPSISILLLIAGTAVKCVVSPPSCSPHFSMSNPHLTNSVFPFRQRTRDPSHNRCISVDG